MSLGYCQCPQDPQDMGMGEIITYFQINILRIPRMLMFQPKFQPITPYQQKISTPSKYHWFLWLHRLTNYVGFKYFVYRTPSGSGRGLHLPLITPGWGLHFPYVSGGQAITNRLAHHHSNPVRPPEPSPGGHHPEAIPILLVINIPPSPVY